MGEKRAAAVIQESRPQRLVVEGGGWGGIVWEEKGGRGKKRKCFNPGEAGVRLKEHKEKVRNSQTKNASREPLIKGERKRCIKEKK